jgi:hypothetical protein
LRLLYVTAASCVALRTIARIARPRSIADSQSDKNACLSKLDFDSAAVRTIAQGNSQVLCLKIGTHDQAQGSSVVYDSFMVRERAHE